ncbi:hypothetical protein E5163_07515 [Marinicauda algicola]|uniref:Outer membrane lipoprotein-sorting protein n=1 Tax=Marinicauda algicola TaxID=2029849 RepID=A0A4S2H0M6_9PROT|nr:hypothetical protein [Marinicauda algicola]TGY88974.1 hypothetical protein E5163_07515 [Marinicauda algicola]
MFHPVLLSLALATGASGAQASADADPLACHLAALGGEAALEAVEAVRVKVQITEPAFTVTGDYRASRDGLMRIDIFDGETRVFTEALDGKSGWQMLVDPAQVSGLSAEGEGALRRGLADNLYGLQEFGELGHSVSPGQEALVDGTVYHTIDVVYSGGFEARLFIDPQTCLLARRRSEFALHPDLDPQVEYFETLYGDYREVDGVQRAFRQERVNLRTGERAQLTLIESFETNPDLEPDQFARPGTR